MNCRGSFALSLLLLACTPQPGATDGSTTADPGATAGTTAEPGTSAAPTTGEPAGLLRCAPTCERDDDCQIGGSDSGFRCLAGLCALPPCADDDACRIAGAGWLDPCTTDAACGPGRACIDVAGEGRCAAVDGDLFTCSDLALVAVERLRFDGGRPVLVCGDDRSTCGDDGRCFTPCLADAECPAQLGRPHCDIGTGQCRCSDDAECQASGQPGLVTCHDGACGCSLDADCLGGNNVDTCVDGACGCSSAAACTSAVFDNVTQVCQPA